MGIDVISSVLGLCSLINIGILLLWWLVLICCHDLIYKLHSKWFKLSVGEFDAVHYAAMVKFKLAMFMFNIVPYLSLQVVKI